MNVFFYGNCQLYAVLKTLQLPDTYSIFHVECWNKKIDKQYFTDIIHKCDVIITQPIQDNYREVDYLSTAYIIQHKKSDCKVIIFDSCHFDFYYFDLTYQMFNGDILRKPSDYHYRGMIDCYHGNKSIDYYIEHFINNTELKTEEELDKVAQDSLAELQRRTNMAQQNYGNNNNVFVIGTHDFIKQNYKDKLLFYSMNHPSKYVIQFICEQIISILQIDNTINYNSDLLNHPKCILYACIAKKVTFDINTDIPEVEKLAQLYFNTYKEIGF